MIIVEAEVAAGATAAAAAVKVLVRSSKKILKVSL